MKYCPYCKKTIEDHWSYCHHCDKPLIVDLERRNYSSINPIYQESSKEVNQYSPTHPPSERPPSYYNQGMNSDSLLNDLREMDGQVEHAESLGIPYGDLILRKASLYYNNQDLSNSLSILKDSLGYFKDEGDILNLAIAYNEIGLIHEERGFFDEALYNFEQSISLLKQTNDIQKLIRVYNNIANVHFTSNELEQAYLYYKQALSLAEEHGLVIEEIQTSSNIVDVLFRLRQFDKVSRILNRNLQYFVSLNDTNGMIITMIKLGKLYYELGMEYYEKAYYNLNKALELIRELQNNKDLQSSAVARLQWECFFYLGKLYTIWSDDKEAERFYMKSLDALNMLTDGANINEAMVLESLSNLYEIGGNYSKALDFYGKAHDAYYRFGKDAKCAEIKHKMARIEKDFNGNETNAISYYEDAMKMYEELDYIKELSTLNHEIGDYYLNKGHLDIAIGYFKRALRYYEEMHDEYNAMLIREKINSMD